MEFIKERIKLLEEKREGALGVRHGMLKEVECLDVSIDVINARLDELTWIEKELSNPVVR